jgi:site-specific DNA-methyltransferase (adenine-specific)
VTVRIETGPGWELRCGDCLDPETGLASLGEKSVDHCITDPPYGQATHSGARTGDGDRVLVPFAAIDDDGIATAFAAVGRVCRRWVVSTLEWQHVGRLEGAPPVGLRFVRFGVWIKENGAPQFTGDRPATGWEAVVVMHGDGVKLRWNGGGHHAVWNVLKHNGEHPTEKPLALVEKWVRDFTDPGDLICDPFAGSATTGVAAIRLGRRFVGWEKSPKYFELALRRLRGAREQFDLFERRAAP